jgi:hypothetical protein
MGVAGLGLKTTVLLSALWSSCVWIEDRSDLDIAASKTSLGVGETVQLSVRQRLPDGKSLALTSPDGRSGYYTTSESRLIPEADGRVTCIGTDGRDEESATIGFSTGGHHGSIRFKLFASGPGPGLEVVADRTTLREGDTTQLHVFKSQADAHREELTSVSATRYLTFTGNGVEDSGVISISGTGLASAPGSIGHFTRRNVTVFVRNGDSVGWIYMEVVHADSR